MSKNSLYLDFDYDFDLLSIISPFRNYRLCWHINQVLKVDFAKQKDIEIHYKKKRKIAHFDLYMYEDEVNRSKYYFINNKSLGDHLIPELKQVDFFLLLKDNLLEDKEDIINRLKELPAIQTVFDTNPAGLKSKQNLVLE